MQNYSPPFCVQLRFVEIEVSEFDLHAFTGVGVKVVCTRDVCWVGVGIPRAADRPLGGGGLGDVLVTFSCQKERFDYNYVVLNFMA